MNNKDIFCSVVIPTYNTGDYLRETIESVLKQSEKNIELIIIDDGSTDDSFHTASLYERSDRRVKCYQQENAGDSAARNNGMKRASGEYIIFLDHDDVLEANCIETQCHILEKDSELKMVVGSNEVINSSSMYVKDNIVKERYFSSEDVALGLTPSFSQCAYRLTSLLEIGGFNPEAKNAADHDLNLRLLKDKNTGYAHSTKVMKYRIHEAQQTKSPSKLMNNHLNALKAYYTQEDNIPKGRSVKSIYHHWYRYYGQFLPSEVYRLAKKKRYTEALYALRSFLSTLPYSAYGFKDFLKKELGHDQ